MREDETTKHVMIAADFKAGIIDRDEARVALGYESKVEYRGQFAVAAKGAGENDDEAELKAVWEEAKHPRDEKGRFTSGIGSGGAPDEYHGIYSGPLSRNRVDELVPPVEHPYIPQGIKVGSAADIDNPRLNGLHSVYDLIGRVRGDGELASLGVWAKTRGSSRPGEYGPGELPRIGMEATGPQPALTFTHENAHYLDNHALRHPDQDDRDYGSLRMQFEWDRRPGEFDTTPAELVKLRDAIEKSQACRQLVEFRDRVGGNDARTKGRRPKSKVGSTLRSRETRRGRMHKTIDYKIDKGTVNYLLRKEELFARAYTQYIATRAGDDALREQLVRRIHFNEITSHGGATEDSLHYPAQWRAEDFAPIAAAFDELLLRKGWMRAGS